MQKKINVSCVPAEIGSYLGRDCCLSVFLKKPTDIWISFNRICRMDATQTELTIVKRYCLEDSYMKILLLDYILGNSDRHIGNMTFCNGKMYPAYDNGRLFEMAGNGFCLTAHNGFVERNIKNYDIKFMQDVFALKHYRHPLMTADEYAYVQDKISRLEYLYNG